MNIGAPTDDAAAVLTSHSMDEERAESNKKVSSDRTAKDLGDADSTVKEEEGKSTQHAVAASSAATVDDDNEESDIKGQTRGDDDGDDDEEGDDDATEGDKAEGPQTGTSKRRRTQRDDDEIPLTFPQKVSTNAAT